MPPSVGQVSLPHQGLILIRLLGGARRFWCLKPHLLWTLCHSAQSWSKSRPPCPLPGSVSLTGTHGSQTPRPQRLGRAKPSAFSGALSLESFVSVRYLLELQAILLELIVRRQIGRATHFLAFFFASARRRSSVIKFISSTMAFSTSVADHPIG